MIRQAEAAIELSAANGALERRLPGVDALMCLQAWSCCQEFVAHSTLERALSGV